MCPFYFKLLKSLSTKMCESLGDLKSLLQVHFFASLPFEPRGLQIEKFVVSTRVTTETFHSKESRGGDFIAPSIPNSIVTLHFAIT